jgi:hypothetical protein
MNLCKKQKKRGDDMSKTGNFYHQVNDETDVAAVGTTFDATKLTSLSLNSALANSARVGKAFVGKIETIVIKVKTVAGGATSITMRGAFATTTVLPDTTATIAFDIGSTTAGVVAFYAGTVFNVQIDTLDIFCKTDSGTVTVDEVIVTWSE